MNSNDQDGKNLATMKKLKNNFTTPEQSKRLLELGVPADSADCYTIINNDAYNKDEIRVRQNEYEINYSFFNNKHYNPCWSVGELMRIYAICFDPDFIHFDTFADGINFLQQMMDKFETYAKNMDFSKLEE